jgi:hypothetical protein
MFMSLGKHGAIGGETLYKRTLNGNYPRDEIGKAKCRLYRSKSNSF